MSETDKQRPISLPVKIGASAVSAIFMAWGLSAVVTQVFDGHTKRGTAIHLSGDSAVLMGLSVMAFGAMPLALLAPNGKAAGFWTGGCVLVALGMVAAILV